jgi:hypothetical protein
MRTLLRQACTLLEHVPEYDVFTGGVSRTRFVVDNTY